MSALPKINHHRNPKLLATAKGQQCTLLLTHGLGHDPATVVWAHSDSQIHGKGRGIKSHDCFGAHVCFYCHETLPTLPRDERFKLFGAAMKATRRHLLNANMVVASPEIDLLKLVFNEDYWFDCWQSELLRVV
jgi:hypothetical protein